MSDTQTSHTKATDKTHLKESLPEEQFVNPTVINVDTGEDCVLPSPSLIGRLLSKDDIHFSIVETTINQSWNLLDKAEVFPLDDNIYLISFKSVEDLDRAWSQRPWDILGCHLLLQHAQNNVTVNEYNLDFTSFWIQMHGLPFNLMVKDVAVKIGSNYGEVEEFDTVKRKFVRMRIKWNTKRPITPGFLLPRQNMDPAWVNFRFEKLSNFCFECGSLFHTIGGCSVNNSVTTENIDEVNLRKLGEWVKAPAITYHPINAGLKRQTGLEPQILEPQILNSQILEPQILEPQILDSQILEPQIDRKHRIRKRRYTPQIDRKHRICEKRANEPQILVPRIDIKRAKHENRNDNTVLTKDSGVHKVNQGLFGQHENENSVRITRPLTLSVKFNNLDGYGQTCVRVPKVKNLSIFKIKCHPVGKKVCGYLSLKEKEKINWYILRNCDEIQSYMIEHKSTLSVPVIDIERIHQEKFWHWFMEKIYLMSIAGDALATPEIISLANMSIGGVYRYDSCVINDVKWITREKGKRRKTQHYGVCTIIDGTPYYGELVKIVEVQFCGGCGGCSVVLFECKWYNTNEKMKEGKIDHGVTIINPTSFWRSEEPYILAAQAKKVFYIDETNENAKRVVSCVKS